MVSFEHTRTLWTKSQKSYAFVVKNYEDAVFYDPNGGIYRGRDEIERIAGVIKSLRSNTESRMHD